MNIKLIMPADGKNDHETLENLKECVTYLVKQLEHILNNPSGYFLTQPITEQEEQNG